MNPVPLLTCLDNHMSQHMSQVFKKKIWYANSGSAHSGVAQAYPTSDHTILLFPVFNDNKVPFLSLKQVQTQETTCTVPNPEHSSTHKSGSSAHLGYVSPEVILPLPKATERTNRIVRNKVKTRTVTDTPEKMDLEKAHKEKEDKNPEQEKNEREKRGALKAANQTETSSPEESSTTDDEAEDGLEKTHSREKKQAKKKKRSGNKKGAL